MPSPTFGSGTAVVTGGFKVLHVASGGIQEHISWTLNTCLHPLCDHVMPQEVTGWRFHTSTARWFKCFGLLLSAHKGCVCVMCLTSANRVLTGQKYRTTTISSSKRIFCWSVSNIQPGRLSRHHLFPVHLTQIRVLAFGLTHISAPAFIAGLFVSQRRRVFSHSLVCPSPVNKTQNTAHARILQCDPSYPFKPRGIKRTFVP